MDAWTDPESDPARAAEREVIRSAEQTVGDAWVGLLLSVESEAEAVVDACARVRRRAAGRAQAAHRADDLAGLAQAQTDLDLAAVAERRAEDAHELASAQLVSELKTWSEATAHRVAQALTDRSGVGGR